MTTAHTLIVTRDPEFGTDAEIRCAQVTDDCAEWVECKEANCRAVDVEDAYARPTAHGQQHQFFDEGGESYWAVRSGFCYAENHGDPDAAEFAEKHDLNSGRYAVDVEVDDSTIILALVAEQVPA